MIIGRKKELQILDDLLHSSQSEFVAIYGRRRVGKTFLVRESFNKTFAFAHTGVLDDPLEGQLYEFRESLYKAGLKKCAMPHSWREAFHLLEHFLETLPDGKKIVFFDELPWMDTPKSNFIRALDHFWNGWATMRDDILLIVCGSATSWIIDNIILNYGGLHNRLTRQIHLHPFTLGECEEFCQWKKIPFTRKQILEGYMAMGGIPYYWNYMTKKLSMAQNIDYLFFSEDAPLAHEYDALYASLFRNPTIHINIINTLATKKSGLTRKQILETTGLSDNETFAKALRELQQCDFIRQYKNLGKKNNATFQLMDNYTLFYFHFITKNENGDTNFWTAQQHSSTHSVWAGLAFERVCLQHLPQIKKALGFSAVISNAFTWHNNPKDGDKGVQIDLLIDRNDDVINLCEMKYTTDKYTIDAEEDEKLRRRIAVFKKVSETKKAIHLTFITTYGLTQGGYSDEVQAQATMDDLFDDNV